MINSSVKVRRPQNKVDLDIPNQGKIFGAERGDASMPHYGHFSIFVQKSQTQS